MAHAAALRVTYKALAATGFIIVLRSTEDKGARKMVADQLKPSRA